MFKIVLFFIALGGTYLMFMYFLSNKFVDETYPKLTQEAGGLILGLSRANYGISPEILEEELEPFNFKTPLINFAIDHELSPYGDVYLNSIKQKIKSNSTAHGLFILSVTPGSFTVLKNLADDAILEFDGEKVLGKLYNFTQSPNYDYIRNCYPLSLYNAIYPTNKWQHLEVHSNGWNEMKLKTATETVSTDDLKFWKEQSFLYYEKSLKSERKSMKRIRSFVETIAFLKEKGQVFIVRLPMDDDILLLENKTWTNFNHVMDSIAKKEQVGYFDYTQKDLDFTTFDGSHLESFSAQNFTKLLSHDIKNYIKNE